MALGDFLARLTGRDREPATVVPSPPTSADLLASLDRVEEMVTRGAVPGVVASRVARVSRVVRDTIPRLDRLGAGSPQAYSVMATATDYLPEAVGGYLRLPRQWADSRPVDRGKTSLMILVDQLDLLAATMDKVLDAVNRADAAALVAHGRFLAEKFATPATALTINPSSTPAPPPPASPFSPFSPASPASPADAAWHAHQPRPATADGRQAYQAGEPDDTVEPNGPDATVEPSEPDDTVETNAPPGRLRPPEGRSG